jgi:hypothetical protein
MGHLAFQGTELINVLQLPVEKDQAMMYLNVFHTKYYLKKILDTYIEQG